MYASAGGIQDFTGNDVQTWAILYNGENGSAQRRVLLQHSFDCGFGVPHATRALDAVANFFRTHEPSSPIPLLIERAKRLVGKDFLQVLAELAPEALAPAKAASGVRDSDDASNE